MPNIDTSFSRPGATISSDLGWASLIHPIRLGPIRLGSVKSVPQSGQYQIPGLIFTNDLRGGNHHLHKLVLNINPGGADSQIRIYVWPAAAQGTVDSVTGYRQNDIADWYSLWTPAIRVDTTSVPGKTNYETLTINCGGIPLGPGDSLVAHSDVANNNTLVALITREF